MNPFLNPNNHLLSLARSGRRLPHLIVVIVLSFVFVLAAQLSGGILAVILILALAVATGETSLAEVLAASAKGDANLMRLLLPDTALEQVILLVLAFAPIFLILWGWLALFEKRPLWTIGLEWPGAGRKYLRGLLIGVVMFTVSIGILAALGYVASEKGGPQAQGVAALGGVLLVFLGWTVQGPAEEALTRGWLLPVIGARYSPALGVVVSSLIFAAFHLLNFWGLGLKPAFIGLTLLNLFLFGLFAALYALHEGSLWGVFGIHAAWNWVQGNFFGLEVSGGPAAGGSLWNLMEVGPDAVTGGPFGPEGGLAVTVVLVVSCIVLWAVSVRKNQNLSV